MVRLVPAVALALGLLPLSAAHAASTLSVPSNTYPTIQSALNAAADGDTIVVAPGTYYENVDFLGKAVTLESSGGPSVTTIDGSGSGTVVSFHHAEGRGSVLTGFTVQNGNADAQATAPGTYEGGGIYISNASPTIERNVIQNNRSCTNGAGIEASFSSALIESNTITGNQASADGCGGGIDGGGIEIGGNGQTQLIGNTISNNSAPSGGGVGLFAAGSPLLEDNRIAGNSGPVQGGGIYAVNQSDAQVAQNLIYGNSSAGGAGVFWSTPSGTPGPTFTNDTIAANSGTALYAVGFDSQSRYYNTIVSASSGYSAVVCDASYQGEVPGFDHSDASPGFGAGCNLVAGDITANPARDPTFHETASSPTVDAGSSTAPGLPATDLDGKPRVLGAAVDIGVYEAGTPAAVASLSPAAAAFGTVPGGSTSTANFTLANTGTAAMSVSADGVSGSSYFSKAGDGCLGQTVSPGASCAIAVSFYAGAPGNFAATLSVTDSAGTQTSSLSATGSMGRPSFTPASLSFGSVKVNKTGGAQTITVKNTGNATLHIFTVSLQGANPGDFKITANSCSGAALAVGATCTVSVQFKPLAVGTRTAALNFPCDDAVSAYSVPLSGTGTRG